MKIKGGESMYQKWLVLFAVVGILFMGYTAKIYGKPDNDKITAAEIQNPNEQGNKQEIARKVLSSTGREGQFDLEDTESVTVYYGNVVLGESQDAVISVKFGPKNTIVAAYTPDGAVYEYVGEVGEFFDVKNIQFIPVQELGKNVVVVREYADQRIGAYEENSFIRGYQYKENEFKPVLNTPEDIRASWNKIWDLEGIQEESNWHRVEQKSDTKWTEGENAALNLIRNQRFSISEDKAAKNIPEAETFTTQNERIVTENFYWSDEWGQFILGEKQDKATGQKVAIIEDFRTSPYILTGDQYNKVRIVNQDGTQDIVSVDTLTDITTDSQEPMFHEQ